MNTESDGRALFADQLGFGFDDAAPIAPAPVSTKTRKTLIVPPAPASEPLTPEAMALALERHADYRVLRRLLEIQELTGISDDMVRGHKLDELRVAAMLADADLVIAHNAGFDRPFVEARLARFAQLPWACSFADLDWKKEGRGSAKLTQLALELGWFYDAHRAEMDCHALLAVLASPLPVSGQTGLAQLLSVAARPSYRLQATAAPFEAKDLLKARGYRWDGEHRVWHTRLGDEAQLQLECEWLKASVYGNRAARVQVERLDAGNRYSLRPGQVEARAL